MTVAATLCPVCKSYQGRWRNLIPYLASATGLFALVASAIAFVISQFSELTKSYYWTDKAEIVFFSSVDFPAFNVLVANNGDGPIFVTELLLRYGDGGNAAYHVNAKIEKNDFFSNKATLGHPAEYGDYINNSTGIASDQVLRNSDIATQWKPCFLAIVYSANASDIVRMNETFALFKRKLISQPADLRLFFYGTQRREGKEVHVPAVLTFKRRSEDRCQGLSAD